MESDLPKELSKTTHLFFLTLTAAFLSIFVWAMVGKLDVVSVASGEVIPSGQIKKVQHLEGGIVKQILVQEGDVITKGQTMVVLESTSSGADVDELYIRLVSLQLDIARLQAKANAQAAPEFPEDIVKTYPDMARQAQVFFETERNKYLNDMRIQEQLIEQRGQDIKQIEVRLGNADKNLKLVNEQTKISEELLQEELNDRYTHISLLREQTGIKSQIEEDRVALVRTRTGLEEARSVLSGLKHTYKENARKQLEEKRQEYEELSRRMKKYDDQLQRTVMQAPVDGVIKSLDVFAVGEVVKPGSTVAEIVPEKDSLIIEALLPPGDIGYIQAGQRATIMLSSVDASRFEKLKGEVTRISPDTFTAEKGFSYYKVQIRPEKTFFQGKEWRYHLKAGVQVTTSILIGKRTVLEYLLEPFIGSFTAAMSER